MLLDKKPTLDNEEVRLSVFSIGNDCDFFSHLSFFFDLRSVYSFHASTSCMLDGRGKSQSAKVFLGYEPVSRLN